MSGICGWVSNDPSFLNKNEINIMHHKLPEGGSEKSVISTDIFHMAARSRFPNPGGQFYEDISVVVDGSDFHWTDLELSQKQKEHGVAHSVADAYIKYGDNFLTYFHGTFSVALYSKKNKTLILAIDRFGVNSLYYTLDNKGHNLFASNLASLIQNSLVTKSINPQAIYNYVYFHFIPSPQTIFNNISKLEPAQILIAKNGHVDVKKYWLPDFENKSKRNIDELAHELNTQLNSSIAKYANTTNVGTFLSGGLDSSTVTGVFSKANSEMVNSFSIGFDADGYDEIEYARIASRNFGTKAFEYYVTPEDIVAALPIVAKSYDEPFGNSSAIPAYFCSRLARENGMKILLAGDGGDEIFAGNERYTKQILLEHYNKIPSAVRKNLLDPAITGPSFVKSIPIIKKIRRYIEQANLSIIDRMDEETYSHFQEIPTEEIFSKDLLSCVDQNEPLTMLRQTYEEVNSPSFVDNMLYLDWKFTLADNDLRKVNRMCEINGIDVRYPMMDENLVNFSCQVPTRIKITETKLRHFFKYATKDLLPIDIINKPKHGFGLPFGVWLKEVPELQDYIYGNLQALASRNIVHPEFVHKIIETHKEGHASFYGSIIWAFAMLEQWLQAHDIRGKIL